MVIVSAVCISEHTLPPHSHLCSVAGSKLNSAYSDLENVELCSAYLN